MALAYIDVAKLHSLVPIHAYVALRDLGVQPGLPSYESAHVYDRLNVVFDHVDQDRRAGTSPCRGVRDQDPGHGRPHSGRPSRPSRSSSCTRTWTNTARSCRPYADRGRQNPAALGPAYGIWPGMSSIIEQALSDLAVALERADLGDDDMVM